MSQTSPNKEITVRVIRDGQTESMNDDWIGCSPEERIEAVWTLTKLCFAWNSELPNEPRLQRTVTHVQRSTR